MDKPRPRAMDITAPRRTDSSRRGWRLTRKQILATIISILVLMAAFGGGFWYVHRNEQIVMKDRYQVVYLLTGQVYFGKLQNTTGQYLTLSNVYTLENQASSDKAAAENSTSNIIQVSRQVYGPEDSMAIRADQIQFWQNLRTDSKVAQAINSVSR
jgi:hypothetical protein